MSRILITDFDGTLCRNEFYQLVSSRLLQSDTSSFWQQFLNGSLSHLEVLQAYFGAIRATEAEVLGLLPAMKLEPRFAELAEDLQHSGWKIIVASAGCSWYIERLLRPTGIDLEIYANPGRWVGGEQGLVMSPPRESRFYHPMYGIDKAAIVREALAQAGTVAYAGDGLTDVPALLLLPADRRFAKRDSAAELKRLGEGFHPFDRWAEVAESLLAESLLSE